MLPARHQAWAETTGAERSSRIITCNPFSNVMKRTSSGMVGAALVEAEFTAVRFKVMVQFHASATAPPMAGKSYTRIAGGEGVSLKYVSLYFTCECLAGTMQLNFGEHTRPRVLRAAPSPVASRRKHAPNGWVVHAAVCSARARALPIPTASFRLKNLFHSLRP